MFPLLYHTHHQLHPDDLPFWQAMASSCSGPILELGCGTGRVLLPLAQAGHSVIGLDNDAPMLAFFRRQTPPALASQIYLFQADLTAFHLARRFELILLPCNTYSTLTAEQRRATLARVQQHLQPGGRFILSLPNPRLLRRLPQHSAPELEDTFSHPLSGQPVEVYSAWRRTREAFHLTWNYRWVSSEGDSQEIQAEVHHTLASTALYLSEITQAGLEVEQTLGSFDQAPFTLDALTLILILRRPSLD